MIPKDIPQVEDLVSRVEEVVKLAAEMAKKHFAPVWWSSEEGYLITREGITLYDHEVADSYGDNYVNHRSVTITWLELLKPEDAIARWKARMDDDKKRHEDEMLAWKKRQYEDLKRQFEGS